MKTERQRRWRKRHIEAGLCETCNEPRVNATHCERHRVAQVERLRARRVKIGTGQG